MATLADSNSFDTAIFPSLFPKCKSQQWVCGVVLIGILSLRKLVFEPAAAWLYKGCLVAKQTKLANYMMEVSAETAALVVFSYYGYFQLLFDPGHLSKAPNASMPPEAAADLAFGANLVFVLLISSYLLQMAFDAEMSFELQVHHWTATVMVFWAYYVASLSNNTIFCPRFFFATSLYMITEQSVFLELLAYHAGWRSAPIYFANATCYATTRVAICALSLWTWWEGKDAIFNSSLHTGFHVYGVFFAVPFVNMLLNVTQMVTVVKLVGIAKKVA